ncbi:MAG: glycosyltransferase family 2 protein [Prolixibacteraceae bacterium]|nr:glycosyltransferase family 2 protein [Prolixibacteraceae bacterium]MBN2648937.1 glycosyltransferase family 2 protein [Prolixibacteraceae bacterium]
MKTIPVVILNWNGLNDTIACVDSVLNQSYQHLKVYVVDNASGNNEFEALTQRYAGLAQVELLRNTENMGFGPAHNRVFKQLIEQGFGNVALLNNDAVADTNWLSAALEAMKQQYADIVACKMLQFSDRNLLDSAGLTMLNTGEILPRGHGKASNIHPHREEVMGFCAGACLIKLSVIDEIGGFDPFFDTGYEDAELSLRAFVNGKTIIYEPQSVVYHKMGQSLVKVKTYKRTLKIMRDINYTALVNLPLTVLLINMPFYLLRNLFILLIFLFTLRVRYILYFFHSLALTIFIDLKYILKSRRKVQHKISVLKMLKAQQFFIKYDAARFYRYILKRTPHKFEQ